MTKVPANNGDLATALDGHPGLSDYEAILNDRKRREIFKCPHVDKKHYAKNMCHNCYHRRGKTKMATACEHTNKPHYSNGLCQNCYLSQYYLKRKKKMEEKDALEKAKKNGAEKSAIGGDTNNSVSHHDTDLISKERLYVHESEDKNEENHNLSKRTVSCKSIESDHESPQKKLKTE